MASTEFFSLQMPAGQGQIIDLREDSHPHFRPQRRGAGIEDGEGDRIGWYRRRRSLKTRQEEAVRSRVEQLLVCTAQVMRHL